MKFYENEDSCGPAMPTEEEWEYAARAGTRTSTYNGDLIGETEHDNKVLGPIAWFFENLGVDKKPQVVGGKEPNDWDLYDMIGNLWEWCNSSYSRWVGLV